MVGGLINHSRFTKYDSPALSRVNSIALCILGFLRYTIYDILDTDICPEVLLDTVLADIIMFIS